MRSVNRWSKRIAQFVVLAGLCIVAIGISVKAQEKYDYVVTDPQYGVNATDTKSDSDAIKELLKKAIGSKEMVTYYFPAGKYYISATMNIYSNTHLILDKDAVIYRMDSMIDKNMLRNVDQNGKRDVIGGYNMSHDIIVEGGTWDGGNYEKATENAVILRIDHAENVVIKDCTVKNVYDCHLITYVGVKNGLISNCKLTGFRYKKGKEKNYYYAREAIQLESAWTDNEKNLNDKSAWWAQGTKIDGTSCQQIKVENNEIIDVPCGIGQHHFTKSGKYRNQNIVIRNNVIKCSSNFKYCRTGITCGGMINLTVTDNVIIGPYRYGMRVDGSSNVVLENNQLEKMSWNGLTVEDAEKLFVRNNSFKNIKNTGIAINDGQVNEVTGNSIYTSGHHGIFVGKSKVSNISNNIVQDVKSNGLCISSGTVGKVDNNTFKNSCKHGISFTGTKKAGKIDTISNNIINKTKLNGVSVNGGKLTNLVGNQIKDAGGHGVSVIDGTVGKGKKNTFGIHKNVIKKCKKNGISVSKKGVVSSIVSNKVSDIKKHGISMSENGKVYWVTKNTVKKCKGKGINNSLKKVKVKIKNNKGQKK